MWDAFGQVLTQKSDQACCLGSGEHEGGQCGGLHGPQGGGQEYVTREVAQGGQGYE